MTVLGPQTEPRVCIWPFRAISAGLEKEGMPSSHCCALTDHLDEISSTCWKINEPASLELIEETEMIIKLNFRITRCFMDDMQLVS